MPRDPAAPTFQAISALPEIRDLIENAPDVLKADISRIKKLLADPAATLPPPIVAFTLPSSAKAFRTVADANAKRQAKAIVATKAQQDAAKRQQMAEVPAMTEGTTPGTSAMAEKIAALTADRGRNRTINPRASPAPPDDRSASAAKTTFAHS